MFTYGDIVKPIMVHNNFEYYIVTDCQKFFNGKTGKKDCKYQLMQIYPVKKLSKILYLTHIDLRFVGNATSGGGKHILDLVEKERKIMGFVDKPDYQKAIEVNVYSNPEELVEYIDESIPRYDLIRTIEEGVDALWDLNRFHEVFGDDSYLQLKEVVLKRMNEIVKNSKKEQTAK